MSASFSLREIAAQLGGEVVGSESVRITRVASLANAEHGQISFLTDSKYHALLTKTKASAVIVATVDRDATTLPRIVTDNPYAYFARVSDLLNPETPPGLGIHPSAMIGASSVIPASASIAAGSVIGRNVHIGENVVIGAGCVIGDHVAIGDHCRLYANIVVYAGCEFGQRCIVHSGAVIGADGFGYAQDGGKWVKIPQVGRVLIADDVEIGANTTIDRGTLDDTLIGEGVKLDNLIQIGHNCQIGAHTAIAGCVGIAGSAKIGRHCRIGGAAMILGHLEIADGVMITPGSMITRSLGKADTYTALMPFQPHDKWLKTAANIRHLDKMLERIAQLEHEIEALKKGTL
jgi:UDP-3-O-[3-hydroxymyristoyl] glucosamine N-acyltransferase